MLVSAKDMTKYMRVNAVIAAINNDTNWDIAESAEKMHFYQLRAAHNVGIFEPFTESQQYLMDYLTNRLAGKRLCDYAWRAFAQSCVSGPITD